MSDEGYVQVTAPDYDITQPTVLLRFVEREGRRILQQRWAITTYDGTHRAKGQHGEWRDVPLRPENDPDDSK